MYYYIQHIRAFVPIAPNIDAQPIEYKNQKENTGKTILAVKNLLYDIALAPNIEIEVPIERQWSLNAEYKMSLVV